jgi:hypothetical protein
MQLRNVFAFHIHVFVIKFSLLYVLLSIDAGKHCPADR